MIDRHELRDRVERLEPSQRAALARAAADRNGAAVGRQLTAWIATRGPVVAGQLSEHLESSLPPYMVPTRFLEVDELPRTPTGKLDRRALETIDGLELEGGGTPFVAPRSEFEVQLGQVWAEVLGVDEIGVHDDFFEIGGDSLLSVRAIARCGRDGLSIPPEVFFETPTIAALAEYLSSDAPSNEGADQGVVIGEAPITPIQGWFLEHFLETCDHWNQSRVFELSDDVSAEAVERAIGRLVDHHDALRLRVVPGERRQILEEPSQTRPFAAVTLPAGSVDEVNLSFAAACERVHTSLRLASGGLFQAILFDGATSPRRLVLIAHHVVIDGVSWDVLIEDLQTLLAGGDLPPKTTSVLEWAEALQALGAEASLRESLASWLEPVSESATAWPGETAAGTAWDTRLEFDPEIAEAWRETGDRHGAGPRDVLVLSVLRAWKAWTDATHLQVDLEGHGRNVVSHLDVSRTVGWFTTVFPVCFELGDLATDGAATAVRRRIDQLPLSGALHGVAKHLATDAELRAALDEQPRSPILVNYLGRLESEVPAEAPLRPIDVPTGAERDPEAPRAYAIEINAHERGGRLTLDLHVAHWVDADDVGNFIGALEDEIRRLGDAKFGMSGLDDAGLGKVANLLSQLDEN